MQWFRWYHSTTRDPKLSNIARNAKVNRCKVIAAWAAILEEASESGERGTIPDINEYTLSEIIGVRASECRRILESMKTHGIISEQKVVAWSKRQKESDDAAERKRRQRERARTASEFDETPSKSVRNPSDANTLSDEHGTSNPLIINETTTQCHGTGHGNVTLLEQSRTEQIRREEVSVDLYNVRNTPKQGENGETETKAPEASLNHASVQLDAGLHIEEAKPDVVDSHEMKKEGENLPVLASKASPSAQLTLVPDQPSKVANQRKDIREAFDRFWECVPRRDQRKTAFAAFEKAIKNRVATADVMIAGIKRYAEWTQRNGKAPQYIALPATWINRERWNDELVDDANFCSKDSETGLRYVSRGTKMLMDMADHGFDVRKVARF